MDEEGRSTPLSRGLYWLDRSRAAGLWLGAGVGLGLGAGAAYLGLPYGLPLGVLGLGGAALLGLTGSAITVPLGVEDPLPMIELPGGDFWMGSAETEDGRYPFEGPRHRVRVSGFFIGQHPVTQGLYQQVMGENPGEPQGDEQPINNVDFLAAARFCNRLSEQAGLSPCYVIKKDQIRWRREADGYRLPSEAEWEYAARAGTTTAYSFGDDASLLGEHAWFAENSAGQVQPVGQKKPNPWDLYDMHGNVLEWCWNPWVRDYSGLVNDRPADNDKKNDKITDIVNDSSPDNDKSPVIDPIGAASVPVGVDRVVRGGSFDGGPGFLRSAFRLWFGPEVRGWSLGFRCVRGAGRQR